MEEGEWRCFGGLGGDNDGSDGFARVLADTAGVLDDACVYDVEEADSAYGQVSVFAVE